MRNKFLTILAIPAIALLILTGTVFRHEQQPGLALRRRLLRAADARTWRSTARSPPTCCSARPTVPSKKAPIDIYCQAGLRCVSLTWTLHRNMIDKPFREGQAEALTANRFHIAHRAGRPAARLLRSAGRAQYRHAADSQRAAPGPGRLRLRVARLGDGRSATRARRTSRRSGTRPRRTWRKSRWMRGKRPRCRRLLVTRSTTYNVHKRRHSARLRPYGPQDRRRGKPQDQLRRAGRRPRLRLARQARRARPLPGHAGAARRGLQRPPAPSGTRPARVRRD